MRGAAASSIDRRMQQHPSLDKRKHLFYITEDFEIIYWRVCVCNVPRTYRVCIRKKAHFNIHSRSSHSLGPFSPFCLFPSVCVCTLFIYKRICLAALCVLVLYTISSTNPPTFGFSTLNPFFSSFRWMVLSNYIEFYI